MSKSKLLITATLALTGALGAGMAQAQGADVQWSVTIGTPAPVVQYYPQPAVVVAPRPAVVVAPRPAVVVAPPPVAHYEPYYPRPRYHVTRWDRDGDGIPNRYDRLYNPAWDRDGDGIANRHDRYDNRRHDRDGDGVPNWHDRRDGRRG